MTDLPIDFGRIRQAGMGLRQAHHPLQRPAAVPEPAAPVVEMAPDTLPKFPFLPRQFPPFEDCSGPDKIRYIQEVVARHFNVSRADILSYRRTASVVRARQIAMYLSKILTPRSLPDIGRRFGDRNHTTVLHAVRKIDDLLNGTKTCKYSHRPPSVDEHLTDDIAVLKMTLVG
jgi:Bacterial dnaA protein helix-turn-helix